MSTPLKNKGFQRYAWFALGYNVLVILWGVFLRASKSGDGCGQHWLTCRGEVLPSAPELKTIIEFSHRMMSALDGLVVLALVVWALVIWRRMRDARSLSTFRFSIGVLFFVLTEAAVGGGLVLTGNTAETLTAARPFWMAGHLVNTFILLAFLTLTARRASGGDALNFAGRSRKVALIAAGIVAILLIGTSGSVAALSSMLFPSPDVWAGLAADLSPTSNVLLRLRLLHPILAIVVGILIILIAGWLRRSAESTTGTRRWSKTLIVLVLVQLVFGAATLLTLSPILMQIGHLLLADLIWISFVMLSADTLADHDSYARGV